MTDSAEDRKKEESDLAFKRLTYAVELFQNEVGRFWQRSLAFWGFVAAAFVAYGVFIDQHNLLALVIACFGLVCSVCWTLINRASRWHRDQMPRHGQMVDRTSAGSLRISGVVKIAPRAKAK
jgi:hypothetical protein